MTLDELRAKIKEICNEAKLGPWELAYTSGSIPVYALANEKREEVRKQVEALFDQHRNQFFEIAGPVPAIGESERWTTEQWSQWSAWHNEREKNIRVGDPDLYRFLQCNAIAFFTCSCGSREDSCAEDGDGNFSRFIFTEDGSVFRSVEKKQ